MTKIKPEFRANMSKVEDNSKYFASSFTPTFLASELYSLCNPKHTERAEVTFVLRFEPFLKYKPIKEKSEKKLQAKDKNLIDQLLKEQFASGSIHFDDESILAKVIKSSDEDSNQSKIHQEKEVDINNNIDVDSSTCKTQEQQDLKSDKKSLLFYISTQRGNLLEPILINLFNEKKKMHFVHNKDGIKMENDDDYDEFKLIGKYDGIDNNAKAVIEIKTTKNLKKNQEIPENYKYQCLTYLKLTKKCSDSEQTFKKCFLLESGPKGEQNEFSIDWDEKVFEESIVTPLKKLVNKYRIMAKSEFESLLKKYNLI